ncbi:MAG: phosphotransferase [Synechococcales bacterium]|nr:phosphotransferase [Synechococcales bacterium]
MPTIALNLTRLKDALREHLSQSGQVSDSESLSLLAHGEANLIFCLGDSRLVRVAVNTPNQRFGGEIRRVTQFEQVILTYLAGTGLSHTLLAAQTEPTPDFPYTYLVTNYLEGRSLNYSRPHLQLAAATLARLHRLPLSEEFAVARLTPPVPVVARPLHLFYQEAASYAQPYLDSSDADPEIVALLKAVLDKAKQRLQTEHLLTDYPHVCLVHSDHTYENWVVNNQHAYLIDWEWAEVGSPAGDLGHFLSPVTIRRRQGYRMPAGDRAFFLQCYYEALGDRTLAAAIAHHFAAFGVFPAVRSLCWTAGYWITANRWYAEAAESPSAAERLERQRRSRQQFPELGAEILAWLDGEV